MERLRGHHRVEALGRLRPQFERNLLDRYEREARETVSCLRRESSDGPSRPRFARSARAAKRVDRVGSRRLPERKFPLRSRDQHHDGNPRLGAHALRRPARRSHAGHHRARPDDVDPPEGRRRGRKGGDLTGHPLRALDPRGPRRRAGRRARLVQRLPRDPRRPDRSGRSPRREWSRVRSAPRVADRASRPGRGAAGGDPSSGAGDQGVPRQIPPHASSRTRCTARRRGSRAALRPRAARDRARASLRTGLGDGSHWPSIPSPVELVLGGAHPRRRTR